MSTDVFSFAFVTDPQIGMNSPFGLRGAASDKERLDRAIAYVNENDIDFLIFGGDQINSLGGEKADEELDVLEESLSALKVPYYGVSGNHDHGDPAAGWAYIDRGMPIRFTLAHKSASFVGISASCLRGDFGEALQQEEQSRLDRELEQTPEACEHRFVVMHWPLLTVHPDEADTYWNMPNRKEIIELFRRHAVSCVLSGHWHQDIDTCWHGISMITSGGTSLPLQYPEERSFKVVTVFPGGWSVRRVSVAG